MSFKTERVTRSIARWGSAAAAIIFGTAFVTDNRLSWDVVSGPPDQIGLIVTLLAIFAGYALAWTKRFEVLGSTIALVSIIAVYAVFSATRNVPPNLFFLVVGAPAIFHLITIVLHHNTPTRVKTLGRLSARWQAVAQSNFRDVAAGKGNPAIPEGQGMTVREA